MRSPPTDREPPWLIIDAYLESDGAENFLPHFTGPVRVLRPTSALLPLDPSAFRGVLITGSAAGVNDRRPWVHHTVAFTRRALQRRVPVLGVCFGHQVLAEAVAGPGAVRRSPLPEVGWFRIHTHASAPILDGFPGHFRTFLSHFDEVRPEVRPHLDVLASSARCPIQAFSVPGQRAWGVQFHAEMGPAETREIVRRRVGSDVPGDPEQVLRGAVDSAPLIAQLVANFTRLAR